MGPKIDYSDISILIYFNVYIAGSMMSGMNMPQGGQASNPTTTMAISQQGTKEAPNTATICRIGQETVQEIVTRYRLENKFTHSFLIYQLQYLYLKLTPLQLILQIHINIVESIYFKVNMSSI